MKRKIRMPEQMPAGVPNHEPVPSEPITSEKLEELIAKMSGHLQEGFATIDRIWFICHGKRELAQGIKDPDEFEEIREAAGKLDEIAADIHRMATTGSSWVDPVYRAKVGRSSNPPVESPENKKECFESHPGRIASNCLLCEDEAACDAGTSPQARDAECDDEHECDPSGKKYRFKCPHCGGEFIQEEFKAYARVCCTLNGEFDPLDPGSYNMEFAEPLDDPWYGANYWCGKCNSSLLREATRKELREWLLENNMDVREPAATPPRKRLSSVGMLAETD